MTGLPFGRFAGIPIRIHPSWTIILTLLVLTAVAQIGALAPTTSSPVRWGVSVAIAIAFLLSATAHELAHALVARRRGVEVTEVLVYFLGTAPSTDLVTTRPRDEIAVALAGPLTSLVIGVLLIGASQLLVVAGAVGFAQVVLVIGALDVVLGAVNLLPAFPLDGGRVARGVGWLRSGDATKGLHFAARSGRVVGLLLGVASAAAVIWLEVVDGLMIALCGWFLISTARSIERGAGLDRLLDGLFVADVMDRDVASLAPTLTVDTFGDQVLDGTAAMALPVRFGDRLMGIVGARQIRQLRRDRWATTRAEDVMVALPRLPIMTPETSLRAALDSLARARTDGLPVMVDGELTGIVTRRGVSEAVRARASKTGQAVP